MIKDTKRSDIHSPTNLVTEDYEFVLCGDNNPGEDDGPGWVLQYGDFGMEISRRLHATDRLDRGVFQCHHCGARMRHFAILEHTPTNELIAVGETCLDNRFSMATSEFQKLRKAAKLDRERLAREELCNETIEAVRYEHPTVAPLLAKDFDLDTVGFLTTWPLEVTEDIRSRFWRYGSISTKQVELIERLIAEIPQRKAEAESRDAEVETPAPTGRHEATGEVIKTDLRESQWGLTLKMTIKVSTDDGVWLGWVTCPSSINNAERGDTVTLTATWEPAEEGGNFAFGKRPSKADILKKGD